MPTLRFRALFVALLCLLTASLCTAENRELAARIGRLQQQGELDIQGARIINSGLIGDYYAQRGYDLAFDDNRIRDVLDGIEGMHMHGLNPDDYHRQALLAMSARSLSPALRADFELLLMDAFLRIAAHRTHGKVNPATLDLNWNLEQPLLTTDPLAELERAMQSASPMEHLDRLLDDADFYHKLKRALAWYRDLAAKGGWREIPSGPSLKPGMPDPRLAAVRARLQVTGELAAEAVDSAGFDEALEGAVMTFQQRHGLDADGIIGPATLAAMNLPVAWRIDQIRVNLERARWVQRELPSDFVLVNIAGFRIYLVRGGELVWSSRVQVGKTYRKTPVFRDAIRYLVFNPTWTVPPGILNEDILPQARKDPDSIRRKGLRVLDGQGQEIDPRSVDWSIEPFPYLVRQDPGPNNALGRVKLMFPNEHLVYLHDTPSKELFDRSRRTTSSGCIRVENPFDLAERVLANTPGWDRARIDQVVASERTTRVDLAQPLPVLILYWTAEVADQDRVAFREDIYARDKPVLRALDQEPKHRLPQRLAPVNSVGSEQTAEPEGTASAARDRPSEGPGAWMIQVASLTNGEGAQRLVNELKTNGFSASVSKVQLDGKTYYRVRLGPVTSHDKAQAMAADLKAKAGYQGQVLKQ